MGNFFCKTTLMCGKSWKGNLNVQCCGSNYNEVIKYESLFCVFWGIEMKLCCKIE